MQELSSPAITHTPTLTHISTVEAGDVVCWAVEGVGETTPTYIGIKIKAHLSMKTVTCVIDFDLCKDNTSL